MIFLAQYERHTAIHHEFRPSHAAVSLIGRHKFIISERIDADFLATVFELGEYIFRARGGVC